MNRTAALCRAAATLCALLLLAAPLATRFGLVSWKLGLPLTALAILGGAVLLLLALVLLALPTWRAARAPLAASALLAALPVLAGIAAIAPGLGLPAIHDGVLQVLSLIAPHLGAMQQEFMDTALAIHSRSGRTTVPATRPKGGKR